MHDWRVLLADEVQADRRDVNAYTPVAGQQWDEVIELAYEPTLVTGALEALAPNASHWTLVSSVSVYGSNTEPGADESADVLDPVDLDDYGQAKVAAEQASREALGERLLGGLDCESRSGRNRRRHECHR